MYQYAISHYKTTRGIVISATDAFEKDLNYRANEAWEVNNIVPFSEDHLMVIYRRTMLLGTVDTHLEASQIHHE